MEPNGTAWHYITSYRLRKTKSIDVYWSPRGKRVNTRRTKNKSGAIKMKSLVWRDGDEKWYRTFAQAVQCDASLSDSPLYCPHVCTVSSCVPCRWTSTGTTSANQSCRSGPEWRLLWSWSAHPGWPPTTDTCLRWEETNLQLLQGEKRKENN